MARHPLKVKKTTKGVAGKGGMKKMKKKAKARSAGRARSKPKG